MSDSEKIKNIIAILIEYELLGEANSKYYMDLIKETVLEEFEEDY